MGIKTGSYPIPVDPTRTRFRFLPDAQRNRFQVKKKPDGYYPVRDGHYRVFLKPGTGSNPEPGKDTIDWNRVVSGTRSGYNPGTHHFFITGGTGFGYNRTGSGYCVEPVTGTVWNRLHCVFQ
ncbi:hypothetical protein HanIR_Chr09g0410881 [Helianthus annuus]|nr:hypothetical protein HanIR_Chr09g0410881 [Helianthus annuus]